MDLEIWKIFTSLGVPGLALGVFYMLFRSFEWKFPAVPKVWVGPLILLFMLLVGSITFYALTLWAPQRQNAVSLDEKINHNTKLLPKVKLESLSAIPVGELSYYPDGLVDLNENSGFLYFYTKEDDNHYLKVISLVSNTIIHSRLLDRKPEAIFTSNDGTNLFVLLTTDFSTVNHVYQQIDNEILVFSNPTLNLINTLKVKTDQSQRLTKGISVGNQLYLTQLSMNSSLYVINGLNGEVVKKIPIGQYPSDILLSPDKTKVYISSEKNVIELSTSSLMKTETYRFYSRINQVDISDDNSILVVAHWEGGISSMDMSSKKIERYPDIHSWGIKVSYDGHYLYCVDNVSGTLNTFSTTNFKLSGSTKVGNAPKAIAVNGNNNTIYITNTEDGTISIIKASKATTY